MNNHHPLYNTPIHCSRLICTQLGQIYIRLHLLFLFLMVYVMAQHEHISRDIPSSNRTHYRL